MPHTISFIVLTFAFTWALLPFASSSVAVSLLALCGPAVAAMVVAALSGGPAWRDLRDRMTRWRVPGRYYALALLAPVAISALARGVELLEGVPASIHVMPITPLQAAVFVLVAGEEIGWRGFLLPRLLPRLGPWGASAATGVIWALWHLPLYNAGDAAIRQSVPRIRRLHLRAVGVADAAIATHERQRDSGNAVSRRGEHVRICERTGHAFPARVGERGGLRSSGDAGWRHGVAGQRPLVSATVVNAIDGVDDAVTSHDFSVSAPGLPLVSSSSRS